jgi:hypothetical protein
LIKTKQGSNFLKFIENKFLFKFGGHFDFLKVYFGIN